MYSNPGIQGVLRTRILALFHRRIEVTRNLVPSAADASVRKQNENLTEENIWPPCTHVLLSFFILISVIIFMFQSWRKLHDHNDSNMFPWKEEHWCKFVCSVICQDPFFFVAAVIEWKFLCILFLKRIGKKSFVVRFMYFRWYILDVIY